MVLSAMYHDVGSSPYANRSTSRRIQAIRASRIEHIQGLPAGLKRCDQSQSMLNNHLFKGHESQQVEKGRGEVGDFSMYWRCQCIFYRDIMMVKVGTGKDRRSMFENIGVS